MKMHRAFSCGVAVSLGLLVWGANAQQPSTQAISAQTVMQNNFNATRFSSTRYSATMEIGRPNEPARRRVLQGTTKLLDGGSANAQRVRFTAPSDLNGTSTLTISRLSASDDLWIYLPSLNRVRRLVSSNRRDAYIGSDFSFGDILGFEAGEWNHRFLPQVVLDGEPCWVVESIPAQEDIRRDFGYSRRVSWVRMSNFVLKQGQYYGPAEQLLKTIRTDQVRAFPGQPTRYQPMVVNAITAQTKRVSTIRFTSFDANPRVQDSEVAPEELNK
jgi:uncharacterized protein